ncbi:MAG: ATP synthase subunit I [Hydrogenophaga sp.]|nr:ATP synthase subunit I [Hydrogenophaga sp.]
MTPTHQARSMADNNATNDWEDGSQQEDFKPLTREEAQQWRARQPAVSLWRLVGWQLLVGSSASLIAWLWSQSVSVGWSVLYGAASVVIPSALMVYGITSSAIARWLSGFAQAAFAGFLLWEGVKILLAVGMLWSAPAVVPDLSWPGLLLGLVLTLKVYWFGFKAQTGRSNGN